MASGPSAGGSKLSGWAIKRRLVGLPAGRHRVEGEARGDPGLLDHVDDEGVAVRLDHRGAAAGILDDIGQGLVGRAWC